MRTALCHDTNGRLLGAFASLLVGCVTPPPTLADYGFDSEDTEIVADTEEPVDTEPVTPGDGPTVLVLDDGGSAAQVVAALRADGMTVVEGPGYDDWDGASPALDDVDVVVFLQGVTYNPRLSTAADTALRDFLIAGGGMVRTEWAAASASLQGAMRIDESLPVVYDDDFSAEAEDWWVDDRDHELTQDVPAKWTEAGAFSEVDAVAAATVIISTRNGNPLLTVREDLPGRVVHLNHDMTGTTRQLTDEMKTLLAACARWADR